MIAPEEHRHAQLSLGALPLSTEAGVSGDVALSPTMDDLRQSSGLLARSRIRRGPGAGRRDGTRLADRRLAPARPWSCAWSLS